MNNSQKNYELEAGKISNFLNVDDCIIRYIDRSGSDEEDDDYSGFEAQGRVTNKSETVVDDLVIDVSYYDNDKFLGLNKTSILEIDELEPDQTIPFKIDLYIPAGTLRCVLNISCKARTGFWNRLLMGGKSKKG